MRVQMRRRTVLAASTALAVWLAGSAAWAAEPTDTTTVDEVVVTANKREERLKDVAMAVTAVGEDRLDRIQASDFQDYAKLVPGLSLASAKPGQTVLTLRGISSLSAGSTVGVYVDDTPYGSSSGLSNGQFYTGDLNTFDVQRVEVLKGPQGTLYGASTLGGLLKFVTNAPDPSGFSGRVVAGVEDVDGDFGWSAKGVLNAPLGDNAAVRLTAVHSVDPGFIDDPSRSLENTNDSVQSAVRLSFLFEPTDRLTVRLTAVGQNSVFNGSNAIDAQTDAIGRPLIPLRPLTGDLQLSHGVSEFSHTKYRIYNGSVGWDLGFGDLTSVTSYSTLRQTQLVDITVLGTVEGHSLADQTKFTQEIRLASKPGDLEWVAGVYYTRETADLGTDYTGFYTALGADLTGSGSHIASTFKEKAVFATVTYHFTPQFDIALGGRFASNDQTTNQTGTGLFAGPAKLGDSSENVFLYSLAPRWRPDDNTIVYGRIASGYRPGGPNVVALGAPGSGPPNFDADKVISGELGLRRDFLDRRLSLDLSIFDIQWDDIQLVGLAVVSGVTTGITLNGGSAESRGFEWTALARPIQGLTLNFNGAYTDAELTSDTTSLVGGLNGEPLPYVPKWTASLGGDYEWSVGEATAFVGASWSYIGERFTDFSPRPSQFEQIRLNSYSTVDLRAGLEQGPWSLEVYAKNVGDERGITALGTNSSAAAAATPGGAFGMTAAVIRPRTIGLSLSARF
ncbi:outer membrane receptor protein involved in Fe transport [Caulobacter ginsengisoli]|uniref:Outer membrane receptor protein involved in Fe transport n=1 Tax=Caulobacter ginsengisoli TaxID=400775 RepID=A0ABU0IKX6_9CAUL|nr:TonB-dependent receptor [Caulobacter ginsengisoli]MDQ0462665.1 outer membrane receptor protein involved in Fe transport [Caulobacter ginsengisoli]